MTRPASTPFTLPRAGLLVVILLLACGSMPSAGATDRGNLGPLEAEIRAVIQSDQLSRSAQERRVASIVRTAVAKATGRGLTPAEDLEQAVAITEAAVRLTPEWTEAIARAVALAPAVARMEDGAAQVLTAAQAAAEGRSAEPAPTRRDNPPAVKPARKRAPAAGGRMENAEPLPNTTQVATARDADAPDAPEELRLSLGENARLAFTASVGIEHDDNIFLSEKDAQGDTLLRVTPGVSLEFGRSAEVRGSVGYRHSFVSYTGNTAPSASLAAAQAQLSVERDRFSVTGALSFQQLNQNNRETAGIGSVIFRRDVLDLSLGTEFGLGAKSSLRTGASLGSTSYKIDSLIGTTQAEIPLKFYFALTPKTSLSVGTSYRTVKPKGTNAGASSRDMFHNLGVRGTLAPKLTGELSIGYRTRKTGDAPGEGLLGLDGTLSLELTPKSSLALLLARDFSTGPLGESLRNNRYTLRFSANPTDQWSIGTALSYYGADYGPYSFLESNKPVTGFRTDRYWETSLLTSYLFTSWFTASADYTLRRNNSTAATAEFSNNVLNLNLGFKY